MTSFFAGVLQVDGYAVYKQLAGVTVASDATARCDTWRARAPA